MTEEGKSYFKTLCEGQCKELCTSGKCKADCCECMMFLESHFKILKKFIPKGKVYYLHAYKDNGDRYVKPFTDDEKCVFLTSDNLCAIHDSHLRPELCRRLGMDGTNALFACHHINEEFKELIDEYKISYLEYLARSGNPIAAHQLKRMNKSS
jgi:hypothetical protein